MCTTHNSQKAGFQEEFTFLDPSSNSTPVIQPVSLSLAPMSSAHPSAQPGSVYPYLLNSKTPTSTHDETEASLLTKVINNLIKSSSSSKPKLQGPDPFDGSNPHKLQTFVLQCKLNFWDCKDLFEDEETKVNYALSYLKGLALDVLNWHSWTQLTLYGFWTL